VEVDAAAHAALMAALAKDPSAQVTIDLASQTNTWPGGRPVTFPVNAFSRTCLLEGVDELGYILKQEARIAEHERRAAGTGA
jgi:3-isopropylmalate/(R)-2-methylmalate dehydratase small subunit